MVILEVFSHDEFRAWLSLHHADVSERWLALKMGRERAGAFYYLDAVEEDLCLGWVDSVKYKLDSDVGVVAQRFSPRKKESYWSELHNLISRFF